MMNRLLNCAVFSAALLCASVSVGADAVSPLSALRRFAEIRCTGYSGSETLSEFPMLVKIRTDVPYGFRYADTRIDGSDITFCLPDGTTLRSECDRWDPFGESVFWVRVPSFSRDTVICMCWDLAEGRNVPENNPTRVWKEYVGVWHMNGGSGKETDVTGHGLDGTPTGNGLGQMSSATDAVVGVGRVNQTDDPKDTSTRNYLSVPAYDAFIADYSVFTVSGWFRKSFHTTASSRPISSKENYEQSTGWEISFSQGDDKTCNVYGSGAAHDYVSDLPDISKEWVYLAFVYDGTTVSVYGDGEYRGNVAVGKVVSRKAGFSIGCNANGSTASWCGSYDEVRIYNGALSAARIKADYEQMANGGFGVFGPAHGGEVEDDGTGFAPGVIAIPEGGGSAAKFVWAADGPVTNNAIAYLRYTFDLESVPDDVTLDYYLDDSGDVYLNGRLYDRDRSVGGYLRTGRNTLAIRLKNKLSSAGAMFVLRYTKDGREVRVISDATGRGTVRLADGWYLSDFNDSSWPKVAVVGDANTAPWAGLESFPVEKYTTPEELVRIEEEKRLAQAWPAGLEQEPDPVTRVLYRGFRPRLEINGEETDPLINICGTGDPYDDTAVVRGARQGFRIVQLNFDMNTLYRASDGSCDFSPIEEKVRRLLRLVPDAYFILSVRLNLPDWTAAHPDEQVGYGDGEADPDCSDERTGRAVRPSAASEKYRTLVCGLIRRLSQYVTARPWGKRMVGFRPGWGVYMEWHCYGMEHAPDTGLRMREKFRTYMKAKRGIDGAEIPTLAQRRHDASKASENGDLLDPSEDQLVLDYYDCLANTIADLLLAFAAEAKQDLPGRLVGAYYGYVFDDHPPEGANVLLDKVLADRNIDFLSGPPFYGSDSRRAGGGFVSRTIPSLFRRYGKLPLLEDDSRFHHVRSWLRPHTNDGLEYATETERETEMCMRRNWLNAFFDGTGLQLNDPLSNSGVRPNFFDEPSVYRAMADSRTALAAAGGPADASGNRVAVVMSGRERLRMDGGDCSYVTWNLYSTSFLYLYRTGAAFDILSLEDYLADPRDYRIVLFLNAFYLTPGERATLLERMRQPGMTAVWFGPAGGVTSSGFDDETMSALVGVTAEGTARHPRIVVRDGDGDVTRMNLDSESVFYEKTFASGARSVFVPEIPDSVDDYVKILKQAGAWLYTDPGSYFRRHGDVFMFHTATEGTHTLRLPATVKRVRELYTGVDYATNEIKVKADGPVTWLFRITESGTWSVGTSVEAALDEDGVLSFTGSGSTRDFSSGTPWSPADVKEVVVAKGVTLGADALSGLPSSTPVTMSADGIRSLSSGAGSGSVPEGSVIVSKAELAAAGAETLTVADGTAVLGIGVYRNSDLTAPVSAWQPVKFSKSDLDVSSDGTRILAPVPAGTEQGFMILRSSAAER